MSLLADLLTRKNSTGAATGKDIPPTLARSHEAPIKVRSLKSRYMAIAAVSATLLALGIFAAVQPELITSLVKSKVPPVQQLPAAAKPPTPATAAAPEVKPTPVATEAATLPQPATPVPTQTAVAATDRANTAKAKVAEKSPRPKPTGAARRGSPAESEALRSEPVASKEPSGEAGKVDTTKRDSFLYAARSAEQASDWRTALANYRKAQKIDPDNHIVLNNTAAALNNLGMFDEGVREARRALRIKPDYVPAMVNAAIAYSSKGFHEEALQLFTDATLADPGNRSLVINLGIQQERAGKLDAAQATYRQLAESDDPLALLGMGRIYELKGYRTEAVRTFRKILTLPDTAPALRKELKDKLVSMGE